jgi:hypothetical protein
MYILAAVNSQFNLGDTLIAVLFTVVALSGVFVASTTKKHIYTSIGLAVPWIAVLWIHNRQPGNEWTVSAISACGAAFLSYTIYLMLQHFFRVKKVGNDLLAGAAAVYFMLGLVFAFIFQTIARFFPDAFTGGPHSLFDLLYFSVITLATLGYGDISPVNPLARMAAILEALTGVLYTAILVGRLIGLNLAGSSDEESS